MELDSWIALIVAILCLLLIAISSAVQTAINNVSGLRLRQLMEGGVPRAQAIQDLINHPDRFPATLVLVNTITLLTIGSLALYALQLFRSLVGARAGRGRGGPCRPRLWRRRP